jgi:hypothetical protein
MREEYICDVCKQELNDGDIWCRFICGHVLCHKSCLDKVDDCSCQLDDNEIIDFKIFIPDVCYLCLDPFTTKCEYEIYECGHFIHECTDRLVSCGLCTRDCVRIDTPVIVYTPANYTHERFKTFAVRTVVLLNIVLFFVGITNMVR